MTGVQTCALPILLRRLLQRVVAIYLLFAVMGRFVERIGAVQFGCQPDCWCKRPRLSSSVGCSPEGTARSTPPRRKR